MERFTVQSLNKTISNVLSDSFSTPIMVEGEISNFSQSSNKHWYFTLNETQYQVRAVMFNLQNQKTSFAPKNGAKVLVTASVSFYKERGDCQLICTNMIPLGIGDLLLEIEERKKRLQKEGLFNQERKLSIPLFPQKIGIITSKQGAAIQDILRVFREYEVPVEAFIFPCTVQGDNAGNEITTRISQANTYSQTNTPLDVLIVSRGGGSLEDLLGFSEEQVVRGIATSSIPVISAVGHEIDHPLSDYVADVQCPTPTAAAVYIAERITTVIESIQHIQQSLYSLCEQKIQELKTRHKHCSVISLQQQLLSCGISLHQKLDSISEFIQQKTHYTLSTMQQKVHNIQSTLVSTSPQAILSRGYTLIYNTQDNTLVTDADMLDNQDEISILFHNGKKYATIKDKDD